MKTQHSPEQQPDLNNSASTDHTTWNYNPDDTVHSVTDARGLTVTNGYNARHLLTSVTYPDAQSLPAGVTPASNVTYAYDAAGNRTSASNSAGTSTYSYDQLSRMTSETYQFSDMSGSYTLNYAYNLANEPTSLSIPFTSQSIGYNYDSTGRSRGVIVGE